MRVNSAGRARPDDTVAGRVTRDRFCRSCNTAFIDWADTPAARANSAFDSPEDCAKICRQTNWENVKPNGSSTVAVISWRSVVAIRFNRYPNGRSSWRAM